MRMFELSLQMYLSDSLQSIFKPAIKVVLGDFLPQEEDYHAST
jgi:hypothetical protein